MTRKTIAGYVGRSAAQMDKAVSAAIKGTDKLKQAEFRTLVELAQRLHSLRKRLGS